MRPDIYWLTNVPAGKLAIMPRPRGGDWLEDELKFFAASGVKVVVSLLTDEEAATLELQQESELCHKHGIRFESFPIDDRGIPNSIIDFSRFINRLYEALIVGNPIAIHCRMGIGRSSIVAACLLMRFGISADEAFRTITHVRGFDVPDTIGQRNWVASLGKVLEEYGATNSTST